MNPHAKALGKLGGKAGTGKAKARTSEQARKAVSQRWKQWREHSASEIELIDRRMHTQSVQKGRR
jgi:hypothetical protein